MPIQNNSGHGNDLLGLNPESGRWEVFEVKASVKASVTGEARAQADEPFPIVTKRLERATEARGHWAAKNVWEEQAKETAERVLHETELPGPGKRLDIDTQWSRVNIERDALSGELKATPEIKDWPPAAQRIQAPDQGEVLPPLPAGFAPALRPGRDLREPEHPGHEAYANTLQAVQRMEAERGIAHGPHTALLAAHLAAEAAECKQGIARVEMGQDGQIHAIERHYADDPGRRFGIEAANATSSSIDASSQRWLAATSPHYLAQHPAAGRSEAHALTLQALTPADRAFFSALRGETPAHVDDAHVAQAMLQAKRNGIHDQAQLAGVTMVGANCM